MRRFSAQDIGKSWGFCPIDTVVLHEIRENLIKFNRQ